MSIFVYDYLKESFRLFVTSKFLLTLASKHLKVLQADATYKLLWLGFPVLIIGMSDREKVFHPIGISLCKGEGEADFEFIFKSLVIGFSRCGLNPIEDEKIDLMADGAHQIWLAFKKVFKNPNNKRGQYYAFLSIN